MKLSIETRSRSKLLKEKQKKQNLNPDKIKSDSKCSEVRETSPIPVKCPTSKKTYKKRRIELKVRSKCKVKNSERRKEKSRDAARCRRGKESEIFNDLASTLPLPEQCVAQLDKASVMRLCIAYLKTRALASRALSRNPSGTMIDKIDPNIQFEFENDPVPLNALDGFLLVLSQEGDVIYSSENISSFLGISQVDVMGQSLKDYTHPCDHEEVRLLSDSKGHGRRHAFLRLKCTLTAKGRNVNLKSASYKVVQMYGQMFHAEGEEGSALNESESLIQNSWIVAVGIPVPQPSNTEIPLDKRTFISKHSLDMKFSYVDESISDLCGFEPDELVGHSLYELNHAIDSNHINESFKTLRLKGQVETGRYRFLAKGGGYVWVVSQATLISAAKDSKPQYVVCLNYVISGVEDEGQIYSILQLNSTTSSISPSAVSPASTEISVAVDNRCHLEQPEIFKLRSSQEIQRQEREDASPPQPLSSKASSPYYPPKALPITATLALLTDRTEDMNKGFLTFMNNDPRAAVLEDQPTDLTHLAPSCGDDCVPLELPTLIPEFDIEEPYESSFWSSSDRLSLKTSKSDIACGVASPRNASISRFVSANSCGTISPKELKSVYSPVVPEEGIGTPFVSPYSHSPNSRFDTPEPPSPAPLLSQTASTLSPVREFCQPVKVETSPIHKSVPYTTKTFSSFDEVTPASATMDFYDFKLEDSLNDDDMDFKAPYVPPIEEMLTFGSDDLYHSGSQDSLPSSSITFSSELDKLDDFSSNLRCHQRRRDSPFLRSHSPHKLNDTGGSFVNPNQVLPGQYVIKGEDDDSSQELRHLLEDSPTLSVRNPVDTPPPLFSSYDSCKRGFSPLSSPQLPSKRSRPLIQHKRGNANLPPPPFAPTLQRLLVSKDPISVRGRFFSSSNKSSTASKTGSKWGSSDKHSSSHEDHSVLRNLLVTGRDDRAGYTVLVSSLSPAHAHSSAHSSSASSSPNSPSHSVSSSKGAAKNPLEDSEMVLPSLQSLASLPLNREGKVELTREQLSTLLGSAGFGVPRIKLIPHHSKEEVTKHVRMPRTPGRRLQDPSLLVSSNVAIPGLLELTSFDYDVNAPAATPSLLQGGDLLSALDQTL